MKTKVTPAKIAKLMAHMRQITPSGVEVREVCCDPKYGVGLTLDSPAGEHSSELVRFSCTPTSEEDGDVPGGWNIHATRQKNGHFVAAWVAGGESLEGDYYACWLSVSATRSGCTYWLQPLEIIEGE